MKKSLISLLILLSFPSLNFAQNWLDDFLAPSSAKNPSNLYRTQKDFNEYWSKYDVKGGYYYIDSVKHKAGGWKQFKRWEWYWETRVNLNTGEFPLINMFDIQQEFYNSQAKSSSDLSNWQSMGPDGSKGGYAGVGRINCIAFHPTNPNVFWAGTPSGGLWKTINGGISWIALTDSLPVIGVSEIVVPNNYDVSKTIFIATGDRDAGDNSSIGVLKSSDDGKTWEKTGLTFNVASRIRITRMLMHPLQNNIMYVATNIGIYKSTDMGGTWNTLKEGVFFDMEFKYGSEDNTLFAVTMNQSGAPIIYMTNNAGANWDAAYTLPTKANRVELATTKSNPDIIYVLASDQAHGMEGIYVTYNGGATFSYLYGPTNGGYNLLNWYENSDEKGGQGWFDLTLAVSPTDERVLYLGGINTWKSSNGGTTWSIASHWSGANGITPVHADKHYMEFMDGNTFFEGNDGGLYKTTDSGETWTDLTNGMVISQMYKLGVSQTVKDEVITGLQDNGSKLISGGGWRDVYGGDGMECLIDYTDENVQYATYVNGEIHRTINRWYRNTNISANIPGGANGAWVTPYIIDPKEHKTIYVGFEDVWKTTDMGDSWKKISSLRLTKKIRSMAIAPSDNKTLYISDFTNFLKTTNGGSTWTSLAKKLPNTDNAVTSIAVDDKDPRRLWITLGGFDSNKVFQSDDGGNTWTNISEGLPPVPANTIIQNKFSKTQQLYVGTDIGVFFREGDNNWTLFSNKLPSVIVTELEIYYDQNDSENSALYASTYGRGLWKTNLSDFDLPEIQLSNIEGPFYVSDNAGKTVSIEFNLNGDFTSNIFTAHLSDEVGSFESPVAIGALESDMGGTFEVQIPSGTPSGDYYRVKVKSSSPVLESHLSNPFQVVLDNTAPEVIISSDVNTSTSMASINVDIIFTEPIENFLQDHISINNAVINSFTENYPQQFQINISFLEAGVASINVPAAVVRDRAGNENIASNQWSITYSSTSIDPLTELGIKLYPNPTKGDFNIDLGLFYSSVRVKVVDILGKVVYDSQLNDTKNIRVNLSRLDKGLYFISFSLDETKNVVSKLMIE